MLRSDRYQTNIVKQSIKNKYIKREIMLRAVKWMDLEIITLSKISETAKDKYHKTPLICTI